MGKERGLPGYEQIASALDLGLPTRRLLPAHAQVWSEAAAQGDLDASVLLGLCHLHGAGVAHDEDRAIAMWRDCANEGHLLAQRLLGQRLCDGGIDGFEEGRAWLERASKGGDVTSEAVLGEILLHASEANPTEALEVLDRAAKAGNAGAHCVLAREYLSGSVVAEDLSRGIRHAEAAAELGFPRAIMLLGDVYRHGRGRPPDPDRALRLYRQAAELGLPEAQCALGMALTSEDPEEAIPWLVRAADEVGEAAYFLAGAFHEGNGVRSDATAAWKWGARAMELLLEHAEADPYAALQVAHLLDLGIGTNPDLERAIHFYRLAARAPDMEYARQRLGELVPQESN